MAKNFKELVAKMSPEAQTRVKAKTKVLLEEMALNELREAMNLTQESLADALNVKQASISKMERRSDMYLSTLRKIIEAMGGRLEIVAIMPDGAYNNSIGFAKKLVSQLRQRRRYGQFPPDEIGGELWNAHPLEGSPRKSVGRWGPTNLGGLR